MKKLVYLIFLGSIACAPRTVSLLAVDTPVKGPNPPAFVSSEEVIIKMSNSKSRLGVLTMDIEIYNNCDKTLYFDPNMLSYTVNQPADDDSYYEASLFPLTPEQIEGYQSEVDRRNRNTAFFVVVAVVIVAVALATALSNDNDSDKKKKSSRSSRDSDSSEPDSGVSGSRRGRDGPPGYYANPGNGSRRVESFRPSEPDRYHRFGARYHTTIYSFNFDLANSYRNRERYMDDINRSYPNVPRDLLLPTELAPGRIVKGRIFFPASETGTYRFVVPVGDKDYFMTFQGN